MDQIGFSGLEIFTTARANGILGALPPFLARAFLAPPKFKRALPFLAFLLFCLYKNHATNM